MAKMITAVKTEAPSTGKGKLSPEEVIADGFVLSPNLIDQDGKLGWAIVVVDRGFVWVGDVMRHGDMVWIVNGMNIVDWGVQKGLGQLATTGPVAETTMHPIPCVIVPVRAVLGLIPARLEAWKKHIA